MVTVAVFISFKKEFNAEDVESAEAQGYRFIEQMEENGPFEYFDRELDIQAYDLSEVTKEEIGQ